MQIQMLCWNNNNNSFYFSPHHVIYQSYTKIKEKRTDPKENRYRSS